MKKFKRVLLACILTLVVLALAACGRDQATGLTDQEQLNLEMTAVQFAYQIISLDDETIDACIEQYEYEQNVPLANGFNSWKSSKDELGDFVDFEAGSTKLNSDGSYTMTIPLHFENRDCEFVLGVGGRFLKDTGNGISYITQLTFNPVYTMGEKLQQAGINLVIGMGTVFVVLIFLAWVISLFKYVHKAEENIEKKKAAKAAGAAKTEVKAESKAPAAAPAVTVSPAPASDDELKAVISAAIAAYEEDMGCSIEKQPSLGNGIVVKSYKRG